MKRVKRIIERLFSWCILYQIAVGGYRYYKNTQGVQYLPKHFIYFGKGARICNTVEINTPGRMYVGDGVFIGPDTVINAVGGVYIGNYSGLGKRCNLFAVEHRYYKADAIPVDNVRIVKPVWIEDFVWIGDNVAILPGIRIGEGAIVGLGSVVTRDVKPLSIVMGNPAKIIGHRNKEHFEKCKAEGRIRPPAERVTKLWIPPLTRRKYRDSFDIFGFDPDVGSSIFVDTLRK